MTNGPSAFLDGLDTFCFLFHVALMKTKLNNMTAKSVCSIILLSMVAVACLLIPGRAQAHPHVFVDCSLTFEFDKQGLKGVRQKWWFDEMFAAMILGDFDLDHDNVLTDAEAKALENGAFVNLKNFDYFTRIFVDGKQFKPVDAIEFKPAIEDSTLVYNFFVPLRIDDNKQKHIVMVAIFDESFYTSVQMDPKNKTLNIPAGFRSTLNLEPVAEMAYFFDQIVPEAAVLTLLPK